MKDSKAKYNLGDKIFIAGHKGMVGSAIYRKLKKNYNNEIIIKEKEELNLINQKDTIDFFEKNRPSTVILAAARVGGIKANAFNQADFLYENLMIQNNVLNSAILNGTKKILFLGSSCIYPRDSKQPIEENSLLSGPLEKTNEGYALAKICGIKLSQFYAEKYNINCISAMPCNLYGFNDSFDPENSHVISGLIKKFVDAKELNLKKVTLWGTGKARREFLNVDDVADAVLLLLEKYKSSQHINIGSGLDLTIKELAFKISSIVNYKGLIEWEGSEKFDGTPQKLLEISKITELGFKPKISLEEGLRQMVEFYKISKANN